MEIRTASLVLRVPELADARRISLLAGDYHIASMTGTIPHPYNEQMAAKWITSVRRGEEGLVFAIALEGQVIGCAGYRRLDALHAELGYWIGKPYWGCGYATEAATALIKHGFEVDGLAYLTAGHFADNPASERVIEKLGFARVETARRDCAARGDKALCAIYQLDRETALAPSVLVKAKAL
jgi:RimJ/RimL family protein N-acetyltransferase